MKRFDEKLHHPDPSHPEVTARVLEVIRSMTPEEAKEFLEFRKPGIPEYWLGKPASNYRRKRSKNES